MSENFASLCLIAAAEVFVTDILWEYCLAWLQHLIKTPLKERITMIMELYEGGPAQHRYQWK